MKHLRTRSVFPILGLISGTFVSGCSLLLPNVLPDPSHSEVIAIEASRSNHELTDAILDILAAEQLVHCNVGRRVPGKDYARCAISWWYGELTKLDRENAEITLGDFPVYRNNIAGHTAKIARKGPDKLVLIVKGTGVYFSELPNRDVAIQVANMLREQL